MQQRAEETVRDLVSRGDFDRAVDRHRKNREAELAIGVRVDQMVRSLDSLRHRLQDQVDNEQRKIDELRRELDEASDNSRFNDLISALFGADIGDSGLRVLDDQILLTGLRTEALGLAVKVLLRARDGDDD
jgi:hypothetical protein